MTNVRQGSIDMRVHDVAREATNLKTSQFTGWDSVRCYKLETTRVWDLSYTPTFVGGQTAEGISIYLKFIADHQDAPFAAPTMAILINDTYTYTVGALDNNGTATNADHGIYTNGWVPDTFGVYSPTGDPNKTNELSWYNNITTLGQNNIKIKVRVFATDSGRLVAKYSHNDGSGLFIS